AHEAIDRGETKYTAVNRRGALRRAVIADYKRRLGLAYADNDICVGGGARETLFQALMAGVEEGAEVIIPAPYWVSSPDMLIGYAAGPAPLVAAINKLQSQMSSCPSSISQAAAAHALTSDQSFVRDSVKLYKERLDYACARLNAIPGLSCLVPDGAFYLYPGC